MAVLHLSADDIVRLNAAQQILLSPMGSGDPVEWQLRANGAVRAFIGADHSLFGVGTETGPVIVTDDTDPTFPERLLAYYLGIDAGDLRFRDHLMERMGRVRRAGGTGAYHQNMLVGLGELRRSGAYHDLFNPAGLARLVGLSTPLPVAEATQFFSFVGPNAEERQELGFTRLQLLVPAFEAGVHIYRRLIGWQTAFDSLLDRLDEALAVYSTRGTLLQRNRALVELLAAEPEAERLNGSADALAGALAERWTTRRGTAERTEPNDGRRLVRTGGADYRLLGSYLPAELFGAEGVLVQVERLRPLLPPPQALQSRFGLSEREAEVALLLAEGLADGAVAERLSLSPHTARRHSERVLRKLGVHSRAAVALTLLRGRRSGSEP